MPSSCRQHLVPTLWLIASGLLVAGCQAHDATSPEGRVAVKAMALSGAAIDRACYDIEVRSGPDADSPLVWARTGLCSDRYGDGAGGAVSYVGTCDANGSPHRVAIALTELWRDGVRLDDWVVPPPLIRDDVECLENRDTPIEANFVVMRKAGEGFFDVAIDFDQIFCSAKVDCRTGADALLHDASGTRGDTAVVALACGLDAGAPPFLAMDDIVLECGGLTALVDPTLGPGRHRDFDDSTGLSYGAQSHAGAHGASSYWTVAIGLGETNDGPCTLMARMTATRADVGGDLGATSFTAYPVITVAMTLDVGVDGGLSCQASGLDEGGPVQTIYVDPHDGSPAAAPFGGCFDPGADDPTSRCPLAPIDTPEVCPKVDADPNDGTLVVGQGAQCTYLFDPTREHTALQLETLYASFDAQAVGTPLLLGGDPIDGFIVPAGPAYPGDEARALNPQGDGDGLLWTSSGDPGAPTFDGDQQDCFGAVLGDYFAAHPDGTLRFLHTLSGARDVITLVFGDGHRETWAPTGSGEYYLQSDPGTRVSRVLVGSSVAAAYLCLDPRIEPASVFGHAPTETYLVALVPSALTDLPAGPSAGPTDPFANLAPPPTLREIAMGEAYACAIMSNGEIDCWGNNANGRLGFDTSDYGAYRIPGPVHGLPLGAVAISVGRLHACALLGSGEVYCWGYDREGAVGDGENSSAAQFVNQAPVRASGLEGAIALATGRSHTCAATGSGSVYCWGNNSQKQLGQSTFPAFTPQLVPGVGDVVELAATNNGTCARRVDGAMWCWGEHFSDTPTPFAGLSGVVELAAKGDTVCAIFGDRSAECWTRAVALGLGLTDVTDLDVSMDDPGHLCAVKTDGTVWCWGENTFGQLGDGTTTARTAPTRVAGLTGLTRVAVGATETCARNDQGQVWCWGRNDQGQLGLGDQADRLSPVAMDILAVRPRQLAPGSGSHCARLALGYLDCAGQFGSYRAWLPWGGGGQDTNYGGVVHGAITRPDGEKLSGVVAASTGPFVGCVVLSDGTARCAGQSQYGQQGDGLSTSASRYATVALSNLRAVSVGEGHACAITAAGRAWCWGDNRSGQLGDGTRTTSPTPVAVDLPAVRALATGSAHTCALLEDGSVSCWGRRLATGTSGAGSATLPVAVPGLADVVAIEAHSEANHTCARRADGTMVCWGFNNYGQIGDGTTTNRLTPFELPLAQPVRDLAVGKSHSCGALIDGTVWCWGASNGGAGVGPGATGPVTSSPILVPGIGDAIEVAAGYGYTCARRTDHNVWCWRGGPNVEDRFPKLARFH